MSSAAKHLVGAVALTAALSATATPAGAQAGALAYSASDGWSVPFTVWSAGAEPGGDTIREIAAAGGASRRLLRRAEMPAYSPSGDRLAYVDWGGHVFVANPDGSGRRQLVPDRAFARSEDRPTWSPDGSRIAAATDRGLRWAARGGGRWRRLTYRETDLDPAWGPDGRIAFARLAGGLWRIFVVNPDGSALRQVTAGATSDRRPAWSPDGSTIAFQAESSDRIDIHSVRADGTGLARLTLAGPDEANRDPAWSPDGTVLAYTAWGPFGNDSELMTLDLRSGVVSQLTANATDELHPAWRPGAAPFVAAAQKGSPLSRRRRPGAGIRAFMKIVHGGAGGPDSCQPGFPFDPPWARGPMITFAYRGPGQWVYHGGRAEIGTNSLFCFFRFAANRSAPRPRFEVTSSAGVTTTVAVARESAAVSGSPWAADWASLPGQEGDYVALATQGARSATTTFKVVPAEAPRLLVLGHDLSPDPVQRLGRDVRVVLAGLPPNARIVLDLYSDWRKRSEPAVSRFQYLNSIPVRAGADGTAVHTIATSARDRPGAYWLALRLGRRVRRLGCVTMQRRLRPATCWAIGENPDLYGK